MPQYYLRLWPDHQKKKLFPAIVHKTVAISRKKIVQFTQQQQWKLKWTANNSFKLQKREKTLVPIEFLHQKKE